MKNKIKKLALKKEAIAKFNASLNSKEMNLILGGARIDATERAGTCTRYLTT